MARLSQYRLVILISLGILLLYFVFRLPNLTIQPIFADEAIYIRWAQVMRAEPTLRFLPLSDGKTPLFMWAMIPLFKIISDPLYAGRFLSVLSGLLTLSGVFFLGWKFFNLKTALWSSFLVATSPFIVFFDRMALVDSLLSAFFIWSLNLSLLLIRIPRADLAMCLGYLLGGALLTKTTAMFNILVLPTSLLAATWQTGKRQSKFIRIFIYWVLALVITFAIYNILRLGPGFSSITSRNQDYIFSPWELQGRWLDPFIPHFYDILDWFTKMLTIPVLILVVVGGVMTFLKKKKDALVVFLWSMIPLLIQMAFLKTFTARYILFSIPPLLLLAGWELSILSERFKEKSQLFTPLILIILMPLVLIFNYYLLTNPAQANLPRSERSGYFEEWTAGYGFKEIANFLDQESKIQPIVVGTEGSFGTLPDGLQIYLDKNRQVAIVSGKAVISAELRSAALDHPTYFVANKSRFVGADGLTLIKQYPKAISTKGSQDAILLFQVLAN